MTSPQKAKGSSFEREVAKFLSKIYNESFIRAPGSGAYVGGKNQERKQFLHEGQIRSFKGDIVPGQTFTKFNAEAKSYADFPFHLMLTGSCKILDTWIEQLMAVAEEDDCNILFMKFNRKGRYVAVQAKYTWVTDYFIYYSSTKVGDWVFIEFDTFFENNKDLFKAYSGSTSSSTSISTSISSDTMSDTSANILTINI
jgi:hypothetical protein